MSIRLKITGGGQISVPAAIRRRWGSTYVAAEDHGDHLVVRPAPEDPIEAFRGIFAEQTKDGPTYEQIRREEREAEAEAEERKWGSG